MASPPALQWVSILSPFLTRPAPNFAILRHVLLSSSNMDRASFNRISLIALTLRDLLFSATHSILARSQKRLTAVGRDEARYFVTLFNSFSNSAYVFVLESLTPRTTPSAPAMPIAGAPLTCSVFMACQRAAA